MIAELGLFFLMCAALVSLMLAVVPAIGVIKVNPLWQKLAHRYALILFILIGCSWLCLTLCFVENDFSVRYVMANSSVMLPWFYKLCAVWGGHEGSMLLWVAVLAFWTLMISLFSRELNLSMQARVLSVLGALSFGLIVFILVTSNPFLRQFQIHDTVGRDLNPLLQDVGFLFHPPMLYMGYVGFSVAFAFAIAALWAGRVESQWCKWTRPWTLIAWSCLTAGITLGSWWAYRELGWGGWWFWDPVENASFMPWLCGTALIHSLAVTEKRGQFKAWTILLAITAFSLSLIGTFLVRSGVLTSVHAFAVDPMRGLYILIFLGIVIGGSLLLFACRAQALSSKEHTFWFSREGALLVNNVLLLVLMLTVLMGTLYPLVIDALSLGKLSVGAPYFNTVFVPLFLPMPLVMGLGMLLRFKHDRMARLLRPVLMMALVSIGCSLIFYIHFKGLSIQVYLAFALALWLVAGCVMMLYRHISQQGMMRLSASFAGMLLAHLGVAITMLGIALSTTFGLIKDVRMHVSDTTTLGAYQIRFLNENALTGPNYHGTRAAFEVKHQDYQAIIYPEKRIYNVNQMAMTDSAIDANVFRDVYIALGEPLGDGAWTVRLYLKPFIRWIWAGGFMMLAGGMLAFMDRRYYLKKQVTPMAVREAL